MSVRNVVIVLIQEIGNFIHEIKIKRKFIIIKTYWEVIA